ncbi:hypothetical protein [Mycolicibacterium gilvum]|uniref:Uncharacterized protein n=1 Tax=Mycolicibacterium gilvum (strain DSM 45189 / LMG 24558 / Spyr1) TaxID=278137 RepID=E6TH01_MYCSR|nr:hypothetical protein [Mycolicibacterium gilvum]ADT97881.1 hypothetical protein Mspyr1_12000 [Mycolicibacterium gilvum Spyr1]
MSWNHREGAPFRARKLLADLDHHGVQLDGQVLDALTHLDRVEAEKPAEPDPQALHDAIVAGASTADLDALVLTELGSHRIRAAYAQARLTAAVRVLAAVLTDRDQIHAQLADKAADCIDKLERIAALDAPLDTLIREGRHDDARLLADAHITGETLNQLYQLRDLALIPASADLRPYSLDVSRWRNPDKVAHGHGTTATELFVDGLRRGGTLWYPSADEQAEALAPLVAEVERTAQRKHEQDWGVGAIAR